MVAGPSVALSQVKQLVFVLLQLESGEKHQVDIFQCEQLSFVREIVEENHVGLSLAWNHEDLREVFVDNLRLVWLHSWLRRLLLDFLLRGMRNWLIWFFDCQLGLGYFFDRSFHLLFFLLCLLWNFLLLNSFGLLLNIFLLEGNWYVFLRLVVLLGVILSFLFLFLLSGLHSLLSKSLSSEFPHLRSVCFLVRSCGWWGRSLLRLALTHFKVKLLKFQNWCIHLTFGLPKRFSSG